MFVWSQDPFLTPVLRGSWTLGSHGPYGAPIPVARIQRLVLPWIWQTYDHVCTFLCFRYICKFVLRFQFKIWPTSGLVITKFRLPEPGQHQQFCLTPHNKPGLKPYYDVMWKFEALVWTMWHVKYPTTRISQLKSAQLHEWQSKYKQQLLMMTRWNCQALLSSTTTHEEEKNSECSDSWRRNQE